MITLIVALTLGFIIVVLVASNSKRRHRVRQAERLFNILRDDAIKRLQDQRDHQATIQALDDTRAQVAAGTFDRNTFNPYNQYASSHLPTRHASPAAGRAVLLGLFVVALITGIIVLIVQAVNRSNADNTRRAAEYASEEAALERAVRDGKVDCFVTLEDGGSTEEVIATNKHFPCNSVPLQRTSAIGGDSYWTVVTVKGVSAEAAHRHNISMLCKGRFERTGSSEFFSSSPGELRADVDDVAWEATDDPPGPIDCQVTGAGKVIRTIHIDMALDKHRRFEK